MCEVQASAGGVCVRTRPFAALRMRKQAPRALVPWWALPPFESCLQKRGPHTLPVICHSHLAAIDAHRITRHGGVP